MSTLFAIDPGPTHSALVCLSGSVVSGQMWENGELVSALLSGWSRPLPCHLVIEQMECYGMPVGREVFDTVLWSGRFIEAWRAADRLRLTWSMLPRKTVKLTLCGSMKAKDPHIRQALIDRYGGAASAKKGGALAGIKSHLWAALAVAETYRELQQHAETGAQRA